MKKSELFRRIMLFWTFFIGLGAVCGATGMLIAPDGSAMGMQPLLPYFQVLPFADVLYQNFLFPGLALLIVNGLSNLTAAFLLLKRKKSGAVLSCVFGVTLMLWITIQFIIFPANFLSTAYFIFGALQFLCGCLYLLFLKQDAFRFVQSDYPAINANADILVAYFSRLGYTRKIAYERANLLGAAVYEITTPERTQGFLGFSWLGRFAMHHWAMPITPIPFDIAQYKKLIVVTPVHVFTVAAPVKGFLQSCRGKIAHVEWIGVHYRKNSDFPKVFEAMDAAIGRIGETRESIVCRYGNVLRRRLLPVATPTSESSAAS